MRSTDKLQRCPAALLMAVIGSISILCSAGVQAELSNGEQLATSQSSMLMNSLSTSQYRVSPSTGISRYQERIGQIESRSGSYAPELFQELYALGRLQYEAGQYETALASLQRAAQLSRINKGLYSEDQISLTRLVIDTLHASGRHDEIEAQLESLVRLSSRYYGAEDIRTAVAFNELGEWKLASYISSLGEHQDSYLVESNHSTALNPSYETFSPGLQNLYDAQELFLRAIRVMVQGEAFADPALADSEQNLLQTYYLNANRERMLQGTGDLWDRMQNSPSRVLDAASFRQLPEDYQKGLDSYRRQLGYMRNKPDVTYGELADTMLAMADWHQLFNRPEKAREQRRQLRELLDGAGLAADEISRLMYEDKAVALPVFMDTPLSAGISDAGSDAEFVDVAISQNSAGRVLEAEILNTSCCVSEVLQKELLGQLKNSSFRIRDDSSQSTLRYYFH